MQKIFPDLKNKKIIVWGTGDFYQKCKGKINLNPYCFIDNNSNNWGQKLDGKLIYSPSILNEIEKSEVGLLILSSFFDEILLQVKEMPKMPEIIMNWDMIESGIYDFTCMKVKELKEKFDIDIKSHICDLCGESSFELLYDKGRNRKILFNYICLNCGAVFTYPRLTIHQHEELYLNGEFSKKARKSERPDDEKFKFCESQAYERFKLIETLLPTEIYDSRIKKVIEIGSGTGSFLNIMSIVGWETLGVEPDKEYANSSMERYNISVKNSMLENTPIPANYADLVCSFQVIEHVQSPFDFLTRVKRFLKEDGYIFIECPGIDNMHTPMDDFFWDVHVNTFSEEVLKSYLLKSGFNVVSSGYNSLGFLWVLGKKSTLTDVRNLQIINFKNAQRIKNIVGQAKSPLKKNAEKIAVLPTNYPATYKFGHVGYHLNTNAGDTLLFPYVRKVFQSHFRNCEFKLFNIHEAVTEKTIESINKLDALIIGGGGLFLADTNPNEKSGWQWPCPTELLKKIEVPIIVFAAGYNRFRGQSDFLPVFYKNIQTLIEKSVFFGIRNSGSIKALKEYVPQKHWNKIEYQPCPTTLIKYLDPIQNQSISKKAAINIAMDRPFLRFGRDYTDVIKKVIRITHYLIENNWNVKLFHHHHLDEQSRLWFKRYNLEIEEVNLNQAPPDKVIEYYSEVDLSIGMRGHAQMVPFGLGKPIFSLISHDKLKYFLEDIGHPEWGVDVHSPDMEQNFIRFVEASSFDELNLEINRIQSDLWSITNKNIQKIKNIIDNNTGR
nr:polysaccharide pyruvyl transferase family protein [Cohnella algarum]